MILSTLKSENAFNVPITFFSYRVQTTGLGGMKPNTVILGWPYGWRQTENERTWHTFLKTVRNVAAARMALLVPKGINFFPNSSIKVKHRLITPSLCIADTEATIYIYASRRVQTCLVQLIIFIAYNRYFFVSDGW